MRKLFVLFALAIFLNSFGQDPYKVTIDLTQIKDDQVPVEVIVPPIQNEEVEYHMAKIVPGTYSISDFGRFVVDLKAYDKEDNPLGVKKTSTNRWVISNATKLNKINYLMHDSFDEFDGYGSNKIFEPGGMGLDAENNVHVMNTFGFVGYIDGMKFNPYELTIKHDEAIFGATSLKKIKSDKTTDTFTAENFNFLADAPIMYSEPDTVTKTIAGAKILVSVYFSKQKAFCC